MDQQQLRALVVDDEKGICDLLQQAIEYIGCQVQTACEGNRALALAQENRFDAIFLDIKMPGMNGVELLKRLRQIQPQAAFVMITGYAGSELVDESLSSGAFICLSKPFGLAQVAEVIKSLREERQATAAVSSA